MNKGAHLKVEGVHGAPQLFLPYHVLEEVKSTPKIELQSKSTFEVGHYFCLPTPKIRFCHLFYWYALKFLTLSRYASPLFRPDGHYRFVIFCVSFKE